MSTSGFVKSFLPAKGFGFISGEDGRNYFFHGRDVAGGIDGVRIFDGMPVSFEAGVTPKGYRAYKVQFSSVAEGNLYEVPREFLVSKSSEKEGWEILQVCDWVVTASDRGDPAEVRQRANRLASQIGANGAIYSTYRRDKGQEGNYEFTVHVITIRPVVFARKSSLGGKSVKDFPDINQACRVYKEKCLIDFNGKLLAMNKYWKKSKIRSIFIVVISMLFWFFGSNLGLLASMAAVIASLIILVNAWPSTLQIQGEWLWKASDLNQA
jgi:cold shock CspA family protein